ELDAGVEQCLDHPQLEQVLVAVAAAAATAGGVGERRPDQVGPRPVVELAVRDADHLRGLRAAEPLVAHRVAAHRASVPAQPSLCPSQHLGAPPPARRHQRSYGSVSSRAYAAATWPSNGQLAKSSGLTCSMKSLNSSMISSASS